MLCFSAKKLINQEMDGLLPARKLRALEEHVARCASCAAYRDELETGRRLLRAASSEPSDSFEWTLQLKLNRALQGAAASHTVPWEDAPARGIGDWLRGFAVSSLAGAAIALAFAIWVLPQRGADPIASGTGILADAGSSISAVTLSAGDADRRPLASPRYRTMSPGSAGLGRTVSGARTTQPNMLDRSGWLPTSWNGSDLDDLDAIAKLRAENTDLRLRLQQLQREYQALLGDREIRYLESDDNEAR